MILILYFAIGIVVAFLIETKNEDVRDAFEDEDFEGIVVSSVLGMLCAAVWPLALITYLFAMALKKAFLKKGEHDDDGT